MGQPVMRIVPNRKANDCAIVAVAMFAGRGYEEVLHEVGRVDPTLGSNGLRDDQIRRVLRALSCRFRFRRDVDFDEDYGLLRCTDHLALLRNGLIVEDYQLWDVDVWRKARGYDHEICVHGIFVAADA